MSPRAPSGATIGLAIIGLGPAVQPHAKALAELSGRARVVWAATLSQARADAFAATSPWPVTTNITAAITDPAVQAVLVLTPPSQHLAVAQQALAAGRHVLVEKPLELTSQRAAALVAAADSAGLRLGVVLQHRFREGALALRDLLASGRLGPVQTASMAVPWWRPQAYYDEPGRGTLARDGGGVLLTQAIHTLDLFRALLGVRRVTAAQARTGAGAGIMDFDHGPHRALIADFLDAITQNRAPLVSGADALATQRLIDDILRKAASAD